MIEIFFVLRSYSSSTVLFRVTPINTYLKKQVFYESKSDKTTFKNPEESPAGYQIPRGSAQDSQDGTKYRPTASRHVIICQSLYLNVSWKNDNLTRKKADTLKKNRFSEKKIFNPLKVVEIHLYQKKIGES